MEKQDMTMVIACVYAACDRLVKRHPFGRTTHDAIVYETALRELPNEVMSNLRAYYDHGELPDDVLRRMMIV